MDALNDYGTLIKHVLKEYAAIPYAYDDVERQTVFDDEGGQRRVHGALMHLDIVDGKIWVQRDGTEYGMANMLIDAGVPERDIVPGFQPARLRKALNYAA